MMKNLIKNKKILIARSLVIVSVVVIVIIFRRKDTGKESGDPVSGGGSSQLPEAAFPLKPYSQVGEYSAAKGSYGRQIAELQKRCNDKYGTDLAVDGKYGPATYEAFGKYMGVKLFLNGISEAQYGVYMKN